MHIIIFIHTPHYVFVLDLNKYINVFDAARVVVFGQQNISSHIFRNQCSYACGFFSNPSW